VRRPAAGKMPQVPTGKGEQGQAGEESWEVAAGGEAWEAAAEG